MRKEESVQLRMSLQLNKVSIIFQKQEHFEAPISSLEVINRDEIYSRDVPDSTFSNPAGSGFDKN